MSLAAERGELIERFMTTATTSGSTVERAADISAARDAVALLAARLGAGVVAASRHGAAYAPDGAIVGGAFQEIADAALGISVARLAVAETGSVLLGSNETADRLPAMFALTHVVIVHAARIASTLDDAAPALRALATPGPRQLRAMSFVTGPSRSADIERVITVGVQGPRAMHIVVIDGETR